ncbi:MAG TPA: sialidase family protein [Candidatus Hydrogenedentes bacterium]|nr:sialidase family protein [Candidatus Hydrogenedentota bacterium]HPG65671.1 sialidase family protein [Candidatus Hydrogenedentota bacterium]
MNTWTRNAVVAVLVVSTLGAACAETEEHAAALKQSVARPSEPDFAYGRGYESGVTHYLNNGIFWSILSERWHPDKRDTEADIVPLADGSLLAAWSDFYTDGWQDDDPCRISMRRSSDGGRTWGSIEVLQERIGSNVMSVSLLRTAKGTVLLTFVAKDTPDGTVHYVRRSTDGGKAFGAPILARAGHNRRVANNDRFLELRDPEGRHGDRGRIVLACRDYPGRTGVMVYSDDDGLTWQAGSNVPVVPEWGSQNFNEPGIVELDDGRLWMYGRTTMGFHAQAWSLDRGMTWSTPEPMALRGPCSPLTGERIPDTPYTTKMGWANDILFTFPNHDFEAYPRDHTYTARTPLDAAISTDDARTWTRVRTIEEDPTMQYGYTSITFVPDDAVGMRVLLTTHVQPIPTAVHRPHDLKLISIPLSWFYETAADPRRGIDFADEARHERWDASNPPEGHAER